MASRYFNPVKEEPRHDNRKTYYQAPKLANPGQAESLPSFMTVPAQFPPPPPVASAPPKFSSPTSTFSASTRWSSNPLLKSQDATQDQTENSYQATEARYSETQSPVPTESSTQIPVQIPNPSTEDDDTPLNFPDYGDRDIQQFGSLVRLSLECARARRQVAIALHRLMEQRSNEEKMRASLCEQFGANELVKLGFTLPHPNKASEIFDRAAFKCYEIIKQQNIGLGESEKKTLREVKNGQTVIKPVKNEKKAVSTLKRRAKKRRSAKK